MVSVSVADRNVSERDLHVSKETCMCQKRPTCVRRVLDVFGSFLRNVSERAGETGKERGFCEVYVSKETYMCQKRPACVKRDLHVSKETYMCQKRLLSV